ncbi:MAG: hypothetical protein KAJ52_00160 [Sedimentisphaerales bacterium]|nr:hypothetical protein [Sedimentisphaerales bacterium]
MKQVLLLLFLLGLLPIELQAAEKVYPNRWVYVYSGLRNDKQVEDIRAIARTAGEHGLNGIVLSGGLDRLDKQQPSYFHRLKMVRDICRENNIEIIPTIFSVGYAGSILAQDRNLAAGLPVRDALFVARDGKARLVREPAVKIVNGGFEEYRGQRVKGYDFHDKPGRVSFVDTRVFKEGKASLRFENLSDNRQSHGRVMQEVTLQPHRCYRLTFWIKTENLEPEGCFGCNIIKGNRSLAQFKTRVPSTTDWRKITIGFNSMDSQSLKIYLGVWGWQGGRFWLDDIQIEEVGLLNVLRRPGTPVTVRSEAEGTIYKEEKDFAPIRDKKLNFRFDHDEPVIDLLPGSRIRDNQRLRVSYYHGMAINNNQVTACMSEPELYEIWRRQAKLIHKYLAPDKYLLSMDEIRAGGSCQACKNRNMTMAQILGDCVTRQFRILREVNPQAQVYIWSDMFDPHQNAHGDYYLVDGDFTNSWKYIPKEMGIVCWYYKKRRESLEHFSRLGFKTIAGAYYDGDTLENPRGWLEAMEKTPGAVGIMYTTWQNKYDLLGPFGDMISRK